MMKASKELKFGVGLRGDMGLKKVGVIGVVAEEVGFQRAVVFGDLGFPSPIGSLMSLANTTKKITIGPMCFNASLIHPVEVAQQIAALIEPLRDRLIVGIARGAWNEDVGIGNTFGASYLREYVQVVRGLIEGDLKGYVGKHFKIGENFGLSGVLRGGTVEWVVGSWGPKTISSLLDVCDGVKIGGTASPGVVANIVKGSGIGSREEFEVSVGAVTVVDEDERRARRVARREVARYVNAVSNYDKSFEWDPDALRALRARMMIGDVEGASSFVGGDVLERFSFSGSPGQLIEKCGLLFEAGVECIDFGLPFGLTYERGVEMLGKRVIPVFCRRG